MDGRLELLTRWDPGEGSGMSEWMEKLDAVNKDLWVVADRMGLG